MLLRPSRRIWYLNFSLRTAAESIRNISNDRRWPTFTSSETEVGEDTIFKEQSNTIWPDPCLGILGPRDSRLPFPGNVGLDSQVDAVEKAFIQRPTRWTVLLPEERHLNVLAQQVISAAECEDREIQELLATMPFSADVLECRAHDCPHLVRKDISDLFPGFDITTGQFTVITISQKTKNDMAFWDEDVESEREELMLCFVMAAKEICKRLKEEGYWADFLDPSSGRPYLGEYCNATMFETDERYKHFGLEIEDLGCCKVIKHHVFGTHAFVGILFTTAPSDSSLVKCTLASHFQQTS